MSVLAHAYSSTPAERVVIVNNKPMHEGDKLTSEITLERIVPDGMIFSVRGTRFKAGVQ
jgi:hypothetical protein